VSGDETEHPGETSGDDASGAGETPRAAPGMLERLDAAVLRATDAVLGGGILGIAAVGIANVAARNLFGGSLPFAEELGQVFMLWITFAGVGVAARRARHIRMAAFHDQLLGRTRKVTWMVIVAGTAALLATLAVLAARYLATVHAVGGVTPALRVPLWAVYAIVPVGLALGALEYARTFVHNARREGLHASLEVEDEADVEAPGP